MYFSEETRLVAEDSLENVRELLVDSAESSVDVEELWEEAGGEAFIALKADSHCRLEEITTCWKKASTSVAGEQVECPDHVLASMRNSAITHGCRRVWLDKAGKCQFINKTMKDMLMGKVPPDDSNN